MELRSKAYIYLAASLLIGSFTPAILVLTKGANAFEFFFLASLISIPFGLLLIFRNKKSADLTKIFKNKNKIFYIALAALLTYVPYEYGIAYAEHFISTSLATVIFRLNPILMLLFIPLLLREKLGSKQILALFIAFVGVFIGITGGNLSNITNNPNLPIIIFVFLLALGYALAQVVIKWQMVDNDIFLSLSAFILTVFYALLFIGTGMQFAPLNAIDYTIVFYLAVTNIFSFYMYIHALKVLKTTIVSNTFLLSPFLTFIWTFIFFGQPVEIYYIVIALLVGAGIVIQRTDTKSGFYVSRKARNIGYKFTMHDVTGAFIDTEDSKIKEIVHSGGRVLATKLDKLNFHHIESMMHESRFKNIYTGHETFFTNDVTFIKEVIGMESGDALVIKAGSNEENEEFFEELNNRLSA